jgi:1-acyl-sn-glycerol-3-phosphate acyltransferase
VPYVLVTLLLIPVQALAVALRSRLAERLPCLYHSLCCRLIGLQIECRGMRSKARPTLFVGNHTSYIDIILYGAVIPGSFVAKSEVARWPFFGLLAKLQRTVFVDRRRASTRRERDEMTRRLDRGDNLILFPEGTTDDGNRVFPFRSAFLSVAEQRLPAGGAGAGRALAVQPVSIAYVRLNGHPIGYNLRWFFAWYGDMNLGEHLWRLLGLGRVTVVIQFHDVVTLDDFGSRKALSEHCHRVIAEAVSDALSGRTV